MGLIEKNIHYVWLGGNKIPERFAIFIEKRKELHPDYKFYERSEKTFDINSNEWVKKAVEAKNYAIAADVIRSWALLNYGGIYLDTDVELLKSFNELINNYSFFIGYETNCWFGCAVLGSKKGHPIMKEVFSRYEKPCKKIDRKSNMLCVLNFSASIKRLYNIKLDGKKRIVNNDVILLPREYFFPKHYITKELKITPNTISIHHYGSTWHSKAKMLGVKVASGMVHLLGDHAFGMCFETLARANMLGQLKREYKKFHKNRGIKSYE